MVQKILGVASALALGLPLLASAQTIYSAASSSAQISTTYADLGVLVGVVIVGVLAAWAALVGLRFAIRKATHYVTGRKF